MADPRGGQPAPPPSQLDTVLQSMAETQRLVAEAMATARAPPATTTEDKKNTPLAYGKVRPDNSTLPPVTDLPIRVKVHPTSTSYIAQDILASVVYTSVMPPLVLLTYQALDRATTRDHFGALRKDRLKNAKLASDYGEDDVMLNVLQFEYAVNIYAELLSFVCEDNGVVATAYLQHVMLLRNKYSWQAWPVVLRYDQQIRQDLNEVVARNAYPSQALLSSLRTFDPVHFEMMTTKICPNLPNGWKAPREPEDSIETLVATLSLKDLEK
ncbi:hypothetical protein OIO90_000718 [Microbotryomycetes sp. JL221]|nr:hypothetical protein OIO90_000718 [Microbotryomycetes sp. JL221]